MYVPSVMLFLCNQAMNCIFFLLFPQHWYIIIEHDLSLFGSDWEIQQWTESLLIPAWANSPLFVLGAVSLWMSEEAVKAYWPDVFRTALINMWCWTFHTPNYLPLPSGVLSICKSPCSFKAFIGMAPWGAITFVSALYAGLISDPTRFNHLYIAI